MSELYILDCAEIEGWSVGGCCRACHDGEERGTSVQLVSGGRFAVCCGAFLHANRALEVDYEETVRLIEQRRWRDGAIDLRAVIDTASLPASRRAPWLRLVRDDEVPPA